MPKKWEYFHLDEMNVELNIERKKNVFHVNSAQWMKEFDMKNTFAHSEAELNRIHKMQKW